MSGRERAAGPSGRERAAGPSGRERAAGRGLVLPVTNLLRRPGSRQAVQREVPAEELRVGEAVVERGAPVSVDVVVEASSGDQVTVTGTVSAPYGAECRRCLEPLTGEASARVQEVFDRRPVEGETYLLDGEVIDLSELLRDALVLALPLTPLCRPDCAGPAPDLYPTTLEGEDRTGERPGPGDDRSADEGDERGEEGGDPRWAALRDLRFD